MEDTHQSACVGRGENEPLLTDDDREKHEDIWWKVSSREFVCFLCILLFQTSVCIHVISAVKSGALVAMLKHIREKKSVLLFLLIKCWWILIWFVELSLLVQQ